MDKVFREGDLTPKGPGTCALPGGTSLEDLTPIRHKEFNEFIKGKHFKGRNNYKLRDLKAMFGFKPMITGSPVTISSDGTEPMRFNSMSKASASTGIPYITLLYAERNSRNQVRSNRKEYTIIHHQLKCHIVVLRGKLWSLELQ